ALLELLPISALARVIPCRRWYRLIWACPGLRDLVVKTRLDPSFADTALSLAGGAVSIWVSGKRNTQLHSDAAHRCGELEKFLLCSNGAFNAAPAAKCLHHPRMQHRYRPSIKSIVFAIYVKSRNSRGNAWGNSS